MRDFKIEVGEIININNIKIHRVNRIYYYVNGEEIKVKKSAIIELINNKETCVKDDKIDWQEVNRLLQQAGEEPVEIVNDKVIVDKTNKIVYVSSEDIIDDWTRDEEGYLTNEYTVPTEYIDLCIKLSFNNGIKKHYDNYPYVDNYRIIIYDIKKATTLNMFRYLLDSDKNYDLVENEYVCVDRLSNIFSSANKKILNWFLDTHMSNAFNKVYLSDSVENYWKMNKEKIYDSLYSAIKDSKNEQELNESIDKWFEENTFKYTNEIKRIIDSEIDYKAKRKKEEEDYRKFYDEYIRNSKKSRFTDDMSGEVKKVKDIIIGKNYKESARILHPDLNKDKDTTKQFQILQQWKDVWFDDNGNWIDK